MNRGHIQSERAASAQRKQPNKYGRRHMTIPAGCVKVYSVRLYVNHPQDFHRAGLIFYGGTNDLWPQRDPRMNGPLDLLTPCVRNENWKQKTYWRYA